MGVEDLNAYADDLAGERDTTQKVRVFNAAGQNPDEYAAMIKAGQRLGLPAGMLPKMPEVRQRLALEPLPLLNAHAPVTSQWLMTPENANVAHDDLENLGAIEQGFRFMKDAGRSVAAAPWSTSGGLWGVGAAAAENILEPVTGPIADATGLPDFGHNLAAWSRYYQKGAQVTAKNIKGESATQGGQVRRDIMSGFESLGQNLLMLPATIMSGNPAPMLWGMSLSSGGDAYGQARDKNLSPLASLNFGASQGLLEFATEKIPAIKFLEHYNLKSSLGQWAKGFLVSEVVGEEVATLTQDLNEWAMLQPDKTIGDYLRERPSAALSTLIATAVGGGGQVAITKGAQSLADAYDRKATADHNRAILGALGEGAAASKLRERLPEKFQELVAEITKDGPVENIHIPVERWNVYWQEQGEDAAAEAERVLPDAQQYREAVDSGGDIIIPLANFATQLGGTDHFNGLLNDIKFHPGEMTARELEEFEAERLTEFEASAREAAGETTTPADQQVYDDIYGQVQGRYAPDVADKQARLWQAIFRTQAARLTAANPDAPVTAWDLYEPMKLKITNPLPAVLSRRMDVDPNLDPLLDMLRQGGTVAEKPGLSLLGFMRERGVSDDRGDLKSMDVDSGRKAFKKNILRADGMPLDKVREAAVEAGYLPEGATIDDLLQAVGAELRGNPVLPASAALDKAGVAQQELDALSEHLDRLGVDLARVDNATARKMLQVGTYGQGSYEQMFDPAPWLPFAKEKDSDGELAQAAIKFFGKTRNVMEAGYVLPDGTMLDFSGRHYSEDHPSLRGQRSVDHREFYGENNKGASLESYFPDDLSGSDAMAYFMAVTGAMRIDAASGVASSMGQPTTQQISILGGARKGDYVSVSLINKSTGKIIAESEIENVNPLKLKRFYAESAGMPDTTSYFQKGKTPLGYFNPTAPHGGFEIGLLEKADFSTFLHESGHAYLEFLGTLAERPDAPQQTKDDYAALLKWFDVPDRAGVQREHHEKFARGFEAYLMEGNAPSAELEGIFQRFSAWLTRIYKTLSAPALDVKLTDEVRGVMDRMIATDEEITRARSQQKLVEGFATAEDAGMSAAEFAAYVQDRDRAHADASAKLLKELLAEKSRERKEWWREERSKVYDEVLAEAQQENVYQAAQVLLNGKTFDGEATEPLKLSKADLVRMYGEKFHKSLPRGFQRMYSKDGGTHPDLVAEMFGFSSGDALVKALAEAPPIKQFANAEAGRRMRERHGDMMTDGSIEEEALAAVHSDAQGKILRAELLAIRKKAKAVKPYVKAADAGRLQAIREAERMTAPVQAYRNHARKVIGKKSFRELDPQYYARAEAKAAKESWAAWKKQDYAAAGEAKHKQILNHYLYIEAKNAKDEATKTAKRLQGLTKPAAQSRIGKAGQLYLEPLNDLLDQYEFRMVSGAEIDRRGALIEWVRAREAEGREVRVPLEVLIDSTPVNWKEVSVDHLRAVNDAVMNIVHLAREERHLQGDLAAMELEQAEELLTTALVDSMGKGKPLPLDENTLSAWDKLSEYRKSADASLLKAEQLMVWLDDYNINGPWQSLIFRPLAQAQNRDNDLTAEYAAKVAELLTAHRTAKGAATLLEKKGTQDIIGQDLTHGALIAIALNSGNESNLDKLLRGHGWTPMQLGLMLDKLDSADWNLVQGVWDTIEGLWPEIAAMEERLTGVAPPKIEAREIVNQHGRFRGGYYPVVYDSRHSPAGEKQADSTTESLFDKNYVRATTEKGHTKERIAGAAYPILLDLDVIPRHLAGVIHDLTHREALLNAYRLLNRNGLRQQLNESLGPQYHSMLNKWLAGVANDRNADMTGAEFWNRMMARLRTNTTIVAMGFKATTAISQISGLSQSLDVVKGKYLAQGLAQFSKHPWDSAAWVREKSGEMRHRTNMLDRDLRDGLRRQMGQDGFLNWTRRNAFGTIALADACVSVPTWIGGYRQALAEGLSEEDAIAQADQAVRLSQGSGGAKDLAAVQRNSEFMKLLTMFYSYFNVLYNRQRDMSHEATHKGFRSFPHILARSFLVVVIPAIMGELLAGRGPDDDEDPATWAARKVLLYPLLSVPVLRDIANSAESGFGYRPSPAFSIGETAVKAARGTMAAIEGEKEWTDLTGVAVDLTGYSLGLPTGQAKITGKYLWDLQQGNEDIENPAQFIKNMMFRRKP